MPFVILKQFVAAASGASKPPAEVTPSEGTASCPPGRDTQAGRPTVLFDRYTPTVEPYYAERREDLVISANLPMKSLWLAGSSGVGKTAALVRAFARTGTRFIVISLGLLNGDDIKELLRGLHELIALEMNSPEMLTGDVSWPKLISALSALLELAWSNGIPWILVDEIPLKSDPASMEFLSRIIAVITFKPSTIIPRDLYVERDADRQVREILNDMGRPGYILVARQMGKTNLLLNARRSMEDAETKFVYIDLSNRVSSLSDYFRLVLDTAAEVHRDTFRHHDISVGGHPESTDHITVLREFEMGLRAMLAEFPGRIVIVLDEIDSLASTGFSDQVFSQIRSMYFARANYPDYERLTYILSGVAEIADVKFGRQRFVGEHKRGHPAPCLLR